MKNIFIGCVINNYKIVKSTKILYPYSKNQFLRSSNLLQMKLNYIAPAFYNLPKGESDDEKQSKIDKNITIFDDLKLNYCFRESLMNYQILPEAKR